MKTFTDAADRTWALTLNLGTALAVKDALGVDLLQPEAGDLQRWLEALRTPAEEDPLAIPRGSLGG